MLYRVHEGMKKGVTEGTRKAMENHSNINNEQEQRERDEWRE